MQTSCKNCSQRCAFLTGDSCQHFTQRSFSKHARQQFQPVPSAQRDALVSSASGTFTVLQILLGRGILIQGARHGPRRTACPGHARYALPQKRCSCRLCSHAPAHASLMLWSYRVWSCWWKLHHCMQAMHTAALSVHAVESHPSYMLCYSFTRSLELLWQTMPRTLANSNTQADHMCLGALTLL